jgi:hypothetical protein
MQLKRYRLPRPDYVEINASVARPGKARNGVRDNVRQKGGNPEDICSH